MQDLNPSPVFKSQDSFVNLHGRIEAEYQKTLDVQNF